MASDTLNPRPSGANNDLATDGVDRRVRDEVLARAFEYRGDVTITHRSDGSIVEGYVFDLTATEVRIMVKGGENRMRIRCDDIARLEFTGRDTAAGKSFETWIRKYVEKKRVGVEASIKSDPLGED